MKRFEQICKEAEPFNESRDCSVKAFALIADIPYAKAWWALHKMGRKDRRGFGGAREDYTLEKALREKGHLTEPITGVYESKTIRTFEKEAPKEGRFLVYTVNHVLAVVNGVVEDWTKGRMHRIIRMVEVVLRDEKEQERPSSEDQDRTS